MSPATTAGNHAPLGVALKRLPSLSTTLTQVVPLARDKAHYLTHVLRLKEGDAVRAFNGTSGEWLCLLSAEGRRAFVLRPEEQLALPQTLPDLDYLFAPLKHARLDYLAQKATEMGCRRLRPVTSRRSVVSRVNC